MAVCVAVEDVVLVVSVLAVLLVPVDVVKLVVVLGFEPGLTPSHALNPSLEPVRHLALKEKGQMDPNGF